MAYSSTLAQPSENITDSIRRMVSNMCWLVVKGNIEVFKEKVKDQLALGRRKCGQLIEPTASRISHIRRGYKWPFMPPCLCTVQFAK